MKKVWSNSFICSEALDCPASNKQYPTPVWNYARGAKIAIQGDEGLLTLDAVKLSRFQNKDKSENTFINM